MNHTKHNYFPYIYTFSCRKGEEESLCALEMRSLFGKDSETSILESEVKIDPSRSPFIKERVEVLCESSDWEELLMQIEELPLTTETFKVIFVKNVNLEKVEFTKRRRMEREVGLRIPGEPDLKNPEKLFGVMFVNGSWVFGPYVKSEAIWHRHQQKPNGYSTALSTRVARAVVNIAVPEPSGIKAIDPCCGIGTVLVEALSMGIDIDGSDINPLILQGTRENIAHFGFQGEVVKRDVRNVSKDYDVAIIDLPYNLCSVISPEEQLEMLQSARRFAKKLVVVTVEPIDPIIEQAGFDIVDRGIASKSRFVREVIVCE